MFKVSKYFKSLHGKDHKKPNNYKKREVTRKFWITRVSNFEKLNKLSTSQVFVSFHTVPLPFQSIFPSHQNGIGVFLSHPKESYDGPKPLPFLNGGGYGND